MMDHKGHKDHEVGLERDASRELIGCAIEVHRHLGPGLLESAYESCLCQELKFSGISFQRQVALPVEYKGIKVDCGYRLDLLIDDHLIVELKSVREIEAIHEAQLLSYMKLSGKRLGLLINFNVPILKEGLKRLVL